ncbi:MAG: hypothetical protein ACYCZM_13850, partial [Acidimicrobiales bacterium]
MRALLNLLKGEPTMSRSTRRLVAGLVATALAISACGLSPGAARALKESIAAGASGGVAGSAGTSTGGVAGSAGTSTGGVAGSAGTSTGGV